MAWDPQSDTVSLELTPNPNPAEIKAYSLFGVYAINIHPLSQ